MRLGLTIALCLLVAAPALADRKSATALELAKRGALAFEGGQYAAAYSFYDRAIRIEPHATFIFNRARAAAELGNCESAIADYTLYVELPIDLPTDALDAAWAELGRLEEKCEGRANAIKATAALATIGPPSRPIEPPGAVVPTGDSVRTEVESRRNWRIAAIGAAAITAGFATLGLVEAIRMRNGGHYKNAVYDANLALPVPIQTPPNADLCDTPELGLPGFESVSRACDNAHAGATRANIGIVGGIVGTALTAALVYKGWIARPKERRITVQPAGPGEIGMSAQVSF